MTIRLTLLSLLFSATSWPSLLIAQEIVITEEDLVDAPVYSPYAGRAYADNVPTTIQNQSYTSSIWFTP